MSSKDSKTSSGDQVPFLEEWKAKRERMRLKSSSSSSSLSGSVVSETQAKDAQLPKSREAHQKSTTQRPAGDSRIAGPAQEQDRVLGGRKAPDSPRKTLFSGQTEGESTGTLSPKAKEKKGSGQRKNKTQIEKRKLREKRRSTGVVNFPLESFDDIEGLPPIEPSSNIWKKDSQEQAHTTKVTSTWRADAQEQAHKVGTGGISRRTEEQDLKNGLQNSEIGGSDHTLVSRKQSGNQLQSPLNQEKEVRSSDKAPQERKLDQLQKAVNGEKEKQQRLTQQLQEQEDVIHKLQLDIGCMKQGLNDAKDKNQRLREENQTLLKVVGQLTS
ncbi:LOW QUALITY PROTEIN: PRKC apoptosis WT1 regulator protein-like [Microcaecilia unicolor]|uniref:LOW QUALITY PROTEIN: PRKC apoptosis WT1 regulator protein-like n=1 Tax=Microcaecilia unicolor TaxID=1415580 RepID=A0A6P7XQI9_9AMPH|nr:LOW QUALITY PROTEIN: PRKC apoptosis WT1 regulator protein-like [Microcaecilia unicolor]